MAIPRVTIFFDETKAIVPLKRNDDQPVNCVADIQVAIKEAKPGSFEKYDADNLILKAIKKDRLYTPNELKVMKAEARDGMELDVEATLDSVLKDILGDAVYDNAPDSFAKNILLFVELREERAPKRKFEENVLEQLQAIREDFRTEKKTTISISRITQKHLTALLKELGLSRRTVEFDITPTTKHVSSFVWTDKKEDAHAQEYLTWLEGCINLPTDVNFYITSNKPNLLSTTIASSQFNISGTLDVTIVDKKYVKSRNTAGGIRVGLELKKTVEESNVMQAIAELIAASIYSEYPVVMVLTDLGEDWQFFWLERGCIVDCIFDLKESITLLETIVQQPPPPVSQSISGAPYLQRCSFRTAISQARESDDAIPEDMEVGGLERLLQRPKVDIMDLLPEDDVANMRDVFDVMTPKEIREWQLKRVLDFAMQTPAMQSSMKTEDWRSIYA